jgi:hypothetical protein
MTHTTGDREYTREEMREACRNNYNAGRQASLRSCQTQAPRLWQRSIVGGISSMADRTQTTETERLRRDIGRLRRAIIHLLDSTRDNIPGEEPSRTDARLYGRTMLDLSWREHGHVTKELSDG